MTYYNFKLYITGESHRSEQAVNSLQQLCEERVPQDYCIEIINVMEQPELAEADNILATPTLIRVTPPPARRIIGDLSDLDKVMSYLDLGSK